MRFVIGLSALLLSFPAAAQTPEPLDVEKLAGCMSSNAGEEDIKALKTLMIAALQDDTEAMKVSVADLGMTMMKLAMSKCGLGMGQVADPGFQQAAQKYGEVLGARIMQDAFAKIQ